ncbi:hypothetical protein V5E97_22995 [Singulisphaera sp. Ch08]|uniref:MFS transporter n=1 Tax=Singulisphaera sp. Ch08 TaxID=3120278 RepID=A0AAU7C8W9_9BACT
MSSNASAGVSAVASFFKYWWDGFGLVFTTMCAASGVALPFRLIYFLEQQHGGVTPFLAGVNGVLMILGGPLIFRVIFRALNFERPSHEAAKI